MRLVFAGTPQFAQRSLAALLEAGHEVVLVLSQPDRPARRGLRTAAGPVKQWAQAHGLPVWQPQTLRDPSAWARLKEAAADAMVVAAYGLILPPQVLAIPPHGCLNVHASLLPRWRGAAPIQRAVQAGDARTGITIMQMDAGLDTGPIRLMHELAIAPDEPAGSVHDRLAALGARAIVEALAQLQRGTLPSQPQPQQGVTYAAKLDKAEAAIDWSRPARAIVDQVRAFDPSPGCSAALARGPGVALKVWRAAMAPVPTEAEPVTAPGTVLAAGDGRLIVRCGDGAVELLELQRPGGRRLPAREFLVGWPVARGERFVPVAG